jgi:hypothetical protein
MIKIRAIRTAVFAVLCCALAVAGRAEGLVQNALSPLRNVKIVGADNSFYLI